MLDDNAIADAIQTLFGATRVYGDQRHRSAATKGADFILLAQLPEPQPAWAQQYGRVARFYELKTNNPLYFTKDYELTRGDSDLPTHYSFKVANRLDGIEGKYERLRARGSEAPGTNARSPRGQ